MGKVNPCQSPDPWSQVWALVRGIASVRITGENCSVPAPDARKISLPHRSGGRQWLAGRIHIRIRFWKATARRFGNLRAEARLANSRLGSLRDDVRMLACQRKNCCALTALDGNYGIKTQGVALGCPVAAFQALDSHRHAGRSMPWIYH